MQHVSKLSKENYNLKLEIQFRRDKEEALEKRLAAAENDQRELQDVNEQLLVELEKRDEALEQREQAVEEAVTIIVSLEDKIDRLEKERDAIRNIDNSYESDYFRSSREQPSQSQSTLGEKKQPMTRMPSFLSEQSEGAQALRSLYLPAGHSYKNSDTALSKLEEEAQDNMNSPRLSALSESSFMSIYGNKDLALDDNQEPEEELPQRRHRKSSSVEKWIEHRPVSITPAVTQNSTRKNQYLSINDVMESPLQRLEKLKVTLERNQYGSLVALDPSSIKEPRKSRDSLRKVVTNKTSFDHQRCLPPTPDTISTSTLRHFQANSNDTLAQDAHAKLLLSSSFTIPPENDTYTTRQTSGSIRPHSAGETITSRREGHGWDTETQADDFSSTASTFSAHHFNQPTRVMTPNLFSFGDFDGDAHEAVGNSSARYNDQSSRDRAAFRYAALRSESLANDPRSDGSTPRANHYSEVTYNTSPIDTTPRPNPPDRRSSLGLTTRIRNSQRGTTSSSDQATSASSPATKQDSRKSRLASRLFGKSDTIPILTRGGFSQSQPAPQKTKPAAIRQPMYDFDEDEPARATPPPIKRSRDPSNSTQLPRYRPSSAGNPGTGAGAPNTLRRTNAFGHDGANDEVVERMISGTDGNGKRSESSATGAVEVVEGGGAVQKSSKWSVFARTGSLRGRS